MYYSKFMARFLQELKANINNNLLNGNDFFLIFAIAIKIKLIVHWGYYYIKLAIVTPLRKMPIENFAATNN